MRAATLAFGLTVVFGLLLGLLLTGTGTGASGIVSGEYWILVIIAASVFLGWQVAQFASAPISLVAAPVLVVIMVAVMLGVKFVRLPSAPLVGDGFEIMATFYAAAGVLGALVGRARRLRARTPTGAAGTGLGLAAVMVAVGVAAYAFAFVMGS